MTLRTITQSRSVEPRYDQVKQIAMALTRDGVDINADAVIDRLDYRGDPEIVREHLQRWRQELRSGSAALTFDQPLPAIIEKTVTSLWQAAQQEAALQVAALRTGADAEIAEATAHRVETLAALKRERQRADELERETAEQQKKLGQQDVALAVERERLSQSEATRRAQQTQIDALRQSLAAARQDGRRALAEAQAAADARDRQRCAELTELRTLNGQSERRGALLDRELQTLRRQHRETHDQLAQLSVTLKERDRQHKALGLEREQLGHRIEQLQSQLGRKSAECEASRSRIARLQTDLKTLREEFAERGQQLQQLSTEAAQARQQSVSTHARLDELIETELQPPRVDVKPNANPNTH